LRTALLRDFHPKWFLEHGVQCSLNGVVGLSWRVWGKMGTLRLLVVDDHDVVRQGLRALLQSHLGWEVCGEAVTGEEAVEKTVRLRPDIVILDVALPETGGLDAARRIRRLCPKSELLILTMYDSDDLVLEAYKIGARGFVLKSDAVRNLIAAIESVSQRKLWFSSRVAETVLEKCLKRASPGQDEGRVSLSPREREVLKLLAAGRSNRQVASQYQISVKTVEAHRANLMHKLGLHSISQLTRYAIRNGIIEA